MFKDVFKNIKYQLQRRNLATEVTEWKRHTFFWRVELVILITFVLIAAQLQEERQAVLRPVSQPPSSRQGQPVPGLGDSTGDGKEGTEIKKARKEVGKARWFINKKEEWAQKSQSVM